MTRRVKPAGEVGEIAGKLTRAWNCVCSKTPCAGLDCGVYLPGRAPRKIPAPKSQDELRAIRAKAWATRRAHPPVQGQQKTEEE